MEEDRTRTGSWRPTATSGTKLTPIHARSAFYDVEAFKAGQSRLLSIEREEVGDVRGKSLLHLQCHFGLDTLSWARLGAQATGVDFSAPAIRLARALNDELGLGATFVHSNVYDLPDALTGQFDIVYTSYGVLVWLPDLIRWAAVVAHFLEPGGTFYIVEGHPFMYVFDMERAAEPQGLRVDQSYFGGAEPRRWEAEGATPTGRRPSPTRRTSGRTGSGRSSAPSPALAWWSTTCTSSRSAPGRRSP